MKSGDGWKRLFRRTESDRQVAAHVDDELRYHIEELIERFRARGMSEEEARAAVQRRFDDLEPTRTALIAQSGRMFRRRRRRLFFDDLHSDLRVSLRQLRRSPIFATVTILILALGIGVNTAVFSVVNAILLKPLSYRDAGRLMYIRENRPEVPFLSVAYLNYRDWQEQNESFEEMAIARGQQYNLTGDGEPVRLMGAQVSANLFTTLGTPPLLGRTFEPGDDRPGATPVAILSHALWQNRFGGDPSILGRALTLNGLSWLVIGVLPRDFTWFQQNQTPELWTPIGLWAATSMLNQRGNRSGMNVIARLGPDVTRHRAEEDLGRIAGRLAGRYPETNTGHGVAMMPLQEYVVGDTRTPLLILLGAVGLILLIACADVANLLLARAAGRSREIAQRMAIGAGRWRLIRQLVTESSVLALSGGVVGVILAWGGIALLPALGPAGVPRIEEVGLDGAVLGFTALLAILTGLLFGLAPALRCARADLNAMLRDGGRGSTDAHGRVRGFLVAAEVALALILLIGSGLLIRSFRMVQAEDPGFNPDRVLTAQLTASGSAYQDAGALLALHTRLLEETARLPGVVSAGTINPLPVTNTGWQTRFLIEHRPQPEPAEVPQAEWMQVSPDYFRTMEIPLLRGRIFSESDHQEAPPVVIIDETFAARHFPGEDPIGRRIALGDLADPTWCEIVGVVKPVKVNGPAREADIELYTPWRQTPFAPMTLVLRTAGDPGALAAAVRGAVMDIDPALPVYNLRTMEELLERTVAEQRLAMTLLTVFALLALVLAAAGISGVMSYTVSRRTREICLRMALGASQTQVLGLVIGQGMILVLSGLAVGLVAAAGVTGLMENMLFGIERIDGLTFGTAPVILFLVALAASAIPAWRASRLEPVAALKHD